jgi:hypothetical protein
VENVLRNVIELLAAIPSGRHWLHAPAATAVHRAGHRDGAGSADQRAADKTAFLYIDTSDGARTGYLVEFGDSNQIFRDPKEREKHNTSKQSPANRSAKAGLANGVSESRSKAFGIALRSLNASSGFLGKISIGG